MRLPDPAAERFGRLIAAARIDVALFATAAALLAAVVVRHL